MVSLGEPRLEPRATVSGASIWSPYLARRGRMVAGLPLDSRHWTPGTGLQAGWGVLKATLTLAAARAHGARRGVARPTRSEGPIQSEVVLQ